ncbi:hypothetical protein B0T24DRAFT_643301 [Lasiosphaeria ovina]|uniref:NACHT domain-containing protein n=1 Tax=Lasiosphaeria ovina TaxID=92902 RepID=A0AAE0JSL9_9PEZI|nr:hypothetical protein B0T24DRAFT_643301 [Lasiosphaeria ovina]
MLEESVEGDDGCCSDDGGSNTPEEPPTIPPGSNFDLEAITVEYGHGVLDSSFESTGYVSSDDDGSQGDASEKSSAKAPPESAVASNPISGTAEEDPQQKPVEAEHVETVDMTERAPSPESEHDPDFDGSPIHPRRPLRKESVFMSWLHHGSHIFHISGKAGSGKSTLMKFLYKDARTKLALMEWAGRKKLVTAHFYFWRSAQDELQMSLDGLYRSILFEVLCQCPDLIAEVFPQQWDAMAHHGTTQPGDHMAASAVKRAFELLAAKASNPTHRFCLFIDGLDEYHGDSAAHWELARHLQAWTRQADIKMAISARPHTEFLVTFAGAPNTVIYLHTLTRDDIYRFSLEMFAKDANAATISADACEGLARRIVDKAEGVFLWAWLTVRLLLDSLGRRDKLDVLMRRLDGVPEGLDDLYQRLLATVLGSDRRRSDLMLLLAVTNPFPSPLNAVAYSWLDDLDADPGFPMSTALPSLSTTAALTDALDYVRRQLHSLTKGLLEVCPVHSSDGPAAGAFFAHGIQFFHRTAMDYLAAPAQLATLRTRHHAHLDVDDAFARLRLAEYTSGIRPRPHLILPSDLPHQFLVETLHCLAHDLAVPVAEGFRAVVMHDDVHVDLDASVPLSRARLGYSVPSLCATHGNTDGASVHDSLARASWPHFAAAYAQTRYVLHLVARQPQLLLTSSSGDGNGDGDGGVNGEGADLSLLLSAITGGDAQLVRELLGRGASAAHACVSMRDRTHRRGRLPVWVLAVANCVWRLIEVFAVEQQEGHRYSRAEADALSGPAGLKAVRALGDWLAIGDGNGLVLSVYEASPRAAEADGRGAEHKRELQHGVIDGQLQLRAGSVRGRIDNWGATSDGDEAAVLRYTKQTEGDEESGDDDDGSETSQSESGSERSFFATDGLVFRRYSCTASRFLSLCEQRDWNLNGERHNTQPPLESDPSDDGQSDDIAHSWLFSPRSREKRRRPPVQLDERVHASLSWEGSELGLPFTYRVY